MGYLVLFGRGYDVSFYRCVTVTLVRLWFRCSTPGSEETIGEAGFVRLVWSERTRHDEPESLILAQSERWRHA